MKDDEKKGRDLEILFARHKARVISELVKRRLNENRIMRLELKKWGLTLDSSFTGFYQKNHGRII